MATVLSNRLLESLSPHACDLLQSLGTPVDLPVKTSLYRSEQRPAYVYFMTSGMASVVTSTADGGTAEVGIIGREGVVGALHVIGPAKISTDCFVQLDATAVRVPIADVRAAYLQLPEIRDRLLEFVQEHSLVGSQIAGCNRLHEAEARLARWLLMAQDQVLSPTLNLTQEFLGMMLGTRRTTVSLVAGTLQRLGLIEISRGSVRILNRDALQNLACDCYPIAKNLNDNLYNGDWNKW